MIIFAGARVYRMEFLDLLLDAVLDCLKLVPFLFATVLLMEYIEHRAGERFVVALQKAGRFGPPVGAALGLVPQCGFSAACAHLFNGGFVSAGTLAAVFLATSDEAIPILLANPSGLPIVLKLILTKALVGVIAGMLLDLVWPLGKQRIEYAAHEEKHVCDSDGTFRKILLAALRRTLSILGFLFLVTLALNFAIFFIGEERLGKLLLPGPFQPFLAALVGLIPNCAASVLLTQLYLDGVISFGSAVSGLCAASGIGLLVLLRGKRGKKAYAIVLGTVVVASVLCGSVLQLLS